jgi:hypothetical protein
MWEIFPNWKNNQITSYIHHHDFNHSSLQHFFAKQHLFHKTQVPNLTLETC